MLRSRVVRHLLRFTVAICPGFSVSPCIIILCWTVFGLRRVAVVSVRSHGIRQPLICVPAVRNKRCPTLSTRVLWWS